MNICLITYKKAYNFIENLHNFVKILKAKIKMNIKCKELKNERIFYCRSALTS